MTSFERANNGRTGIEINLSKFSSCLMSEEQYCSRLPDNLETCSNLLKRLRNLLNRESPGKQISKSEITNFWLGYLVATYSKRACVCDLGSEIILELGTKLTKKCYFVREHKEV